MAVSSAAILLSSSSWFNGDTTDDGTNITYASSLFSKTAAMWWYMLVQAGQVPTSWEAFRGKVRSEFIPQDHMRTSRDRLRKLRQRASVASYVPDESRETATPTEIGNFQYSRKYPRNYKISDQETLNVLQQNAKALRKDKKRVQENNCEWQ
jgi:Retrotransposon gag protein